MMVSVETACSRHAGFQISKTVKCFWSTSYIPLLTSIIPDSYNTHLKLPPQLFTEVTLILRNSVKQVLPLRCFPPE